MGDLYLLYGMQRALLHCGGNLRFCLSCKLCVVLDIEVMLRSCGSCGEHFALALGYYDLILYRHNILGCSLLLVGLYGGLNDTEHEPCDKACDNDVEGLCAKERLQDIAILL